MNELGYILLFTFLSGVIGISGGALLLLREKFAYKISHYLASFAAGTLLGAAFFDLLPEANEMAHEEIDIFLWTVIGLLIFFLLERFINWFHHHHEPSTRKEQAAVTLVTLGDSVHNFIDGAVLASTFLVSIPLGIVTSIAVAAHEIPQEIGDFGILLHRGVKKWRILTLNFISACVSLLGALIAYWAAQGIEPLLPIFLSLSAGFFIYIAASDLIPEIHNEDNRKKATIESILLIVGVFMVYFLVNILEH